MRPRHTAAVTALCLSVLATGCVQTQDESIGIREALPTAEAVAIKLPEQEFEQQALGQIADYYVLTRTVSRSLNAGAAWVLILVHTIVQFPATTVEGNVYTWGPHSDTLDPAEWRLVVTANADGTFDWRFDGRNKTEENSQFLTVITGHAVPGADPYRGVGEFYIDFDQGELVNPIENTPDTGNVLVTYDLENGDGTDAFVTMHAEGVDDLGNPASFDYYYGESIDGSGDFQFAIEGDMDDEGTAAESAVIRSRWLADAQGRSDAEVSGGDLGQLSVTATECWNSQFRRVYYADSAEWLPTEGDSADCAFSEAAMPELGQ